MNTLHASHSPFAGQTSDPKTIVAHFLLQVQAAHVRTQSREPVPLHFDSATGTMIQYLWPVDPVTGERIAPSEFESHRRTHELQGPCCLCAFIGGKQYTEARIGIAETVTEDLTRNQSTLNGEIVAVCSKQRCGYFLCLERFYPLRGLKSRICKERRVPLAPEDVTLSTVDVENSFRAGDGLFQVMSDSVIRGGRNALQVAKPQKEVKTAVVRELAKGIPAERFWATFVQCLVCQAVTFRDTFGANHVCDIEEPKRRRYNPYTTPTKGAITTRSRVVASRLQRTYALATIPTSPTPTVSTEPDQSQAVEERDGSTGAEFWEGGDEGYDASAEEASQNLKAENGGSDSDGEAVTDEEEEFPVFGSDVELPSITQVFEQWRQERLAAHRSN